MKNVILQIQTINLLKIILTGLLLSSALLTHAQTFQSGTSKTQLLELYSSQGCSSCPPAERWISRYTEHPQLWNAFIPMVFHVDYWNYLGWKDPFSNKKFSQRQRTYHHQGVLRSVYTPGIIFDGKEWRGWYRGKSLPVSPHKAGVLSASLNGDKLKVSYEHKTALHLNVVLLGFGIKTDIQNGENKGKLFSEDFIVLNKKTVYSKNAEWDLSVNTKSQFKAERYALVIWVNATNSLQPLQAMGGWIEP